MTSAHLQCNPGGQIIRIKDVLISAPTDLRSERIVDNKMMLATNVSEVTALNIGPLNEFKRTKLNLRGLDFSHKSGMASIIIVLIIVLI